MHPWCIDNMSLIYFKVIRNEVLPPPPGGAGERSCGKWNKYQWGWGRYHSHCLKKLFVIICIFIPGRFCQSDCFLINCLSREDKKLVYTWHVWLFTHMHNTERTFKHFYQYFLWINVTCDLPSLGFAGLNVVFVRAVSLDFHPTKDMDLPADLFIFLHFSWVSVFPMDYVRGQAPTYHFTCICIAVPRTFIFLQEAPFRGVGGPPCGVVDDRYDHKDGGGSHIGHSDHQTKSSRFQGL